jgi:IrrE N-terminal-like domain
MPLPRGFKSESERISLAVRSEIELEPSDRLDPRQLADELGIPVVMLDELRPLAPDAVDHLLDSGASSFSAATVFRGTRRMIVANSAHPPGRQANSLAHELAHVLLEHVPGPALDELGARRWSGEYEEQADWLAGALLVPREGIMPVVCRCGRDLGVAAAHFAVSLQLMSWRYNQTGVARQLRARDAKGVAG